MQYTHLPVLPLPFRIPQEGDVGQKLEAHSSSFRSLFAVSMMEAEWESFESEVLRDITDSQFAFQVTLERIEVHTYHLRLTTCFAEGRILFIDIYWYLAHLLTII